MLTTNAKRLLIYTMQVAKQDDNGTLATMRDRDCFKTRGGLLTFNQSDTKCQIWPKESMKLHCMMSTLLHVCRRAAATQIHGYVKIDRMC